MPRNVCIRILEDTFEVAPEDSVLRALQLYGLDRQLPAYGFARFCWNASCKQCVFKYVCDGKTTSDLACQTDVRPGLHVKSVPSVLMWTRRLIGKVRG
jgi:hypothetical protein